MRNIIFQLMCVGVLFYQFPSIDVGGRMRNMMHEEKEGSFSNQDL